MKKTDVIKLLIAAIVIFLASCEKFIPIRLIRAFPDTAKTGEISLRL